MDEHFDVNEAKRFLENREALVKDEREKERKAVLAAVLASLKQLFSDTAVEVYLVGSIIRPNMFHPGSDVDIVLKNFQGDRFDLWAKLERMINRNVEIILFEHCHFQDHILKSGYKVL